MNPLKASPDQKGVLCEGLFTPAPGAFERLGIPPLLNGPLRTDVQFSDISEQLQTMTLTFYLPGGKTLSILARSRGSKPPPVGFGTQHYDAESPQGRYSFEPVAGEQLLDPEKALYCPWGYRFQEIIDRFSKGPIEFRWQVELFQEEDPSPIVLGRLILHSC